MTWFKWFSHPPCCCHMAQGSSHPPCWLLILGGFRAPHTLNSLRRQMLTFLAVGGCCGYSKVLKSRGLLILLKLTLASDEGVYCYVNGRASTESAGHSDLFLPSRNVNREASCYTTEQYGHRQGNRRGCPRAAILPPCLTQNCEYVAKEDRMCTAPSCAKECTKDFTIGN